MKDAPLQLGEGGGEVHVGGGGVVHVGQHHLQLQRRLEVLEGGLEPPRAEWVVCVCSCAS